MKENWYSTEIHEVFEYRGIKVPIYKPYPYYRDFNGNYRLRRERTKNYWYEIKLQKETAQENIAQAAYLTRSSHIINLDKKYYRCYSLTILASTLNNLFVFINELEMMDYTTLIEILTPAKSG